MPEFEYVDPQALDALAGRVAAEAVLGIDTEFMRETTFFPELCLLQLASHEKIYCADPLLAPDSDLDLAGFWQTMADRRWVVHSARQDIEVFCHTAGLVPRELFDTQVAAALLGYAPQLGYAAMVAELFGVTLAKSHTRADWRRRPLPPEYLEYAAEDVEHLLPALEVLTERLTDLGRLEWARQDSMDLLDPALYTVDPATAVDRLKGARGLRGHARRTATELAAWREAQAVRLNRPRQWILKDAALLEIAMAAPASAAELSRMEGVPPKTVRRSGRELLAIVAAARTGSDDYEPPARPDEAAKAALKEMQQHVAAVAAELGIVPEVLAPRKELSEALTGTRDLRVFRGWRREIIGETLLTFL